MDTEQILDRVEKAVTLEGDDAAIRVHAEYQPQAGRTAKVFPPTYLPADGTRYHFEERWDATGERVPVVVLDSFQSQANRVEAALRDQAESLGLPQLVLEAQLEDRTVTVSTLDAPHRSRDAYFLDSELDGVAFDKSEVGQALARVTADDATAALRYAPYDLVFGVWDSHRGKRIATKFARTYSSEMLGWHAVSGKRAATKGDPLNLPGKSGVPLAEWRPETQTAQKRKQQWELNELGHGMIPGQPSSEAGGVSVKTITRDAILSLVGLARYRFPLDGTDVTFAGRAALAALALLGDRLAFGGAGLHLRSGSDLVLTADRVEWVRRGGEPEPFELTVANARELFEAARQRLEGVGLVWDGDPVMLTPSERLQNIIEETFYVVSLDAVE